MPDGALAAKAAPDEPDLNIELRRLVAWSDWQALRGKRAEAVALKLAALAEKLSLSETKVTARFWALVGALGRMARVGQEPEAPGTDGALKRGKFGSKKRHAVADVQRGRT